MPERRRRYDLDERFSLDADPEEVLATILNPTDEPDEDEVLEEEDS